MSAARKNTTRKHLKKRTQTVIVVESPIAAKDTLFPEKVVRANKILRNTKFHDPKSFS